MPRKGGRKTDFTEKSDGTRLAGYNETDCSQRHRGRVLRRTQVYKFHVQMSAMPQKRKELEPARPQPFALTRTENHQNKKHLFYNTTYPVLRIHQIHLYINIRLG